MNPNQFYRPEVANGCRDKPCKRYSLFGKVGNRWQRVSPITCLDKKEASEFFYRSLLKGQVFGIKTAVKPI